MTLVAYVLYASVVLIWNYWITLMRASEHLIRMVMMR
jgi:hypothetical protein